MKNIYKFLVCLFAYPVLTVLTIGLCICALISVLGGIARTFGAGFRMDLLNHVSVPVLLSIPVSLVFSLLVLLIALASWKLLCQSIRFVNS